MLLVVRRFIRSRRLPLRGSLEGCGIGIGSAYSKILILAVELRRRIDRGREGLRIVVQGRLRGKEAVQDRRGRVVEGIHSRRRRSVLARKTGEVRARRFGECASAGMRWMRGVTHAARDRGTS